MPTLTLTLAGANGTAHDWTHVSTPFGEITTLLNSTGLDYLNVQTNGLRTSNMRTHASLENGRIKVRNASGGNFAVNHLVYATGTYSDGTSNYPSIGAAIATASKATNYFAVGILDTAIGDAVDGTMVLAKEVTGLNTAGSTVGDPVFLSTVAGGWTLTRPSTSEFVQVVGYVSVVSATLGRILFDLTMPQEEWLFGAAGGVGLWLDEDRDSGMYAPADDELRIKLAGTDSVTFVAATATFVGAIAAATGTTIGTLTLADGSITDSSGAISFGNENLSTTGTLASGALAVTGAATATTTFTAASDLAIGTGSVTSASGAISFGNENLTTTGTLAAGATTVTGALLSNADDGGALGASGTGWSDLFLASGGVINWAAGNYTLTHASGILTASSEFKVSSTTAATSGTAGALVVSGGVAIAKDLWVGTAGQVADIEASSSSGARLSLDDTSANGHWDIRAGVGGAFFEVYNRDRTASDFKITNAAGAVTIPGTLAAGATTLSGLVTVVTGGNPNLGIKISNTQTDATRKFGGLNLAHYTNAEEPMGMIWGDSDSANRQLHIGGGNSTLNAFEDIIFWTSADGQTVTGTERMRITSAGNVGIGMTPLNKFDTMDGNAEFHDSSVAHGMTAMASATTAYAYHGTYSGTQGGYLIRGLADGDAAVNPALQLDAVHGHASPTQAVMNLRVGKANGTGWQALAATEIGFQFVNYTTPLITILGNGAIKNPVDSAGFYTGAGDDLRMYHDGTNGAITNATGILSIMGSASGNIDILLKSGTENGIKLVPDGAVTLYYDNAAKLATVTNGIDITGRLNATTFIYAPSGFYVGSNGSNNYLIDDASNGAGSAALWIGNASINVTSDRRAKRNVEDFTGTQALDLLSKAHVVSFDYIPEMIGDESPYGPSSRGRYVGMIAQEMKQWAPWAVNDGDGSEGDHMWKAEYDHLVGVLFAAVQAQQEQINTLKARLN